MQPTTTSLPTPGLAIIYSNDTEQLRRVVIQWLTQQPVSPLGLETILVQSNGIAQWLKMALASRDEGGPGVAAGIEIELPNQFIWQLYRAILGDVVPKHLPYDKNNLSWRILHLLPQLQQEAIFEPVRRYLADDEQGLKSYYLALRLADLFDQYQVYRADWLNSWSQGEDTLPDGKGANPPVPSAQLWQPALWRALRQDMAQRESPQRFSSRADVHQQALQALQAGDIANPAALPERLIVFGIAALPQQSVELLAALAAHRQVIMAILNPCRYYWGDITLLKDEIRQQQWRQQRKAGLPQQIDPDLLHVHAPPLLASLGRQGRDYISYLQQFDQPERYRDWFSQIDLFDEELPEGEGTLLQQLQRDILELRPVPTPPRSLDLSDRSITFHQAHSRQREVEILQDRLIADLASDPTLQPRDCMVMMPDIHSYSAHIEAVFGRINRDDPRYIGYTLADQRQRGHNPLLIAVEYLLNLPQQRVTLSEVLSLLEVEALQRRFGFNAAALVQLKVWLEESGVRWGLSEAHRRQLELAAMGHPYSWAAGMERMVVGYAMGETEAWQGVTPYGEVSGLAAAELGTLLALMRQLELWQQRLTAEPMRRLTDWQALLGGSEETPGLLESFFTMESLSEQALQLRLQHALAGLRQSCDAGGFDQPLTLAVVRDSWLSGIDESGLSQRFMAGHVTFSTLLPMRAIPFRRIYMLGMNDKEYPRTRRPDDFDLMAGRYRPGDRSRRDDDRYLFLEALLSTREALYISWIGRSVYDDTPQPPSVLISQLRDQIDKGWRIGSERPLPYLTTAHPLQPFSRRYFGGDVTTYAHEWQLPPATAQESEPLPPLTAEQQPELTLTTLADFMRHPVTHFVQSQFKARYRRQSVAMSDDEPFSLDGLEQYQLQQEIVARLLSRDFLTVEEAVTGYCSRQNLPLYGFGEQLRQTLIAAITPLWHHFLSDCGGQWQPGEGVECHIALPTGTLVGAVEPLYQLSGASAVQLLWRGGKILTEGSGDKSEQPRWHILATTWLQQLAANAMGVAVSTRLYGEGGCLCLPPINAEAARTQLDGVLHCWQSGLKSPLPLTLKSAIAWLQQDEKSSREEIDGSYQQEGALSETPELRRYFSDFDAMVEAGLPQAAAALYGPLTATAWQWYDAPANSHDSEI
ncbi:exodeoxyribonuclease V subunit gamma [Ectothiorhodospiraceae bacterium BW-2]|nr:exodeoxyribonuclease V subunit gamma [Ectothiorhodospiraceae bacterium BW-2]